MRATQKNKISYPVSSTFVGWYVERSLVCCGQPSVENVHSPEENHVSSVSWSCSHPSPSGGVMSQYVSLPRYHGMRCPNHIWRLITSRGGCQSSENRSFQTFGHASPAFHRFAHNIFERRAEPKGYGNLGVRIVNSCDSNEPLFHNLRFNDGSVFLRSQHCADNFLPPSPRVLSRQVFRRFFPRIFYFHTRKFPQSG